MVSDPLRVVHLTTSVGQRSFGLGAVALNLAKTQLWQGWDTQVWCLDAEDGIVAQPECQGFPLDRVLRFPPWGPMSLGVSWRLQRTVARDSGPNDTILHQHGIWTAVSAATRLWSKHQRVAIVAPHGSLDPWAMRRSRRKKALALRAYEGENLRSALCLHALSMAEAEAIREFGLRNPIAIVPNGISTNWVSSPGDPDAFRVRHSIPRDKRILLFLSRITPKKGLPMFVECLRNAGNCLAGWEFVIAGADEFQHEKEVATRVNQCGLTESVKFVGPLFGKEKRDVFAAADAFVLPSYSEGWPIVVLEALGAGVPVLTTTATPLPELENVGAGWRVQPSKEPMTEALSNMLKTPRSVLQEMGDRGRRLVVEHFTWDMTAARLCSVYSWLAGREPQPGFVASSL